MDEHVLGLAVLLVEPEHGLPGLARCGRAVLARYHRLGVGSGGVARDRERLAHPALIEIEEKAQLFGRDALARGWIVG